MDPYHGKQEHKPEAEAMDLPEDLNLDQDEQAGQDEEEDGKAEGPCDLRNLLQTVGVHTPIISFNVFLSL